MASDPRFSASMTPEQPDSINDAFITRNEFSARKKAVSLKYDSWKESDLINARGMRANVSKYLSLLHVKLETLIDLVRPNLWQSSIALQIDSKSIGRRFSGFIGCYLDLALMGQ
nr:hypothetical protein [Tanacetum cinerariifolium]